MQQTLSQANLEAIAKALGHTTKGLTGSEIGHLLEMCGIQDVTPEYTKWKRIYNALATNQNQTKCRRRILGFIRKSMKPSRYLDNENRFEQLRHDLNQALSFAGLSVAPNGELVKANTATTIRDAQRRADELRTSLESRGTHPDVLKFCKAELVSDNYFHAVLEAMKSITDKLRARTGLSGDGIRLIDQVLMVNPPRLAINNFQTESEKSEQRGFANLVKGVYGMFRNPTAHEAKINWKIRKSDAEDLLSIASLIHRRLDQSNEPPYV